MTKTKGKWKGSAFSWRILGGWGSFAKESNFPVAIVLLAICATITAVWWAAAKPRLIDLWPEMGGMTLDVFFILIVFAAFEHRRARGQTIARQHETIEDYKRWESEEAAIRLAGAIRRLNRLNVFAVNLGGIRLTGFSFAKHGIKSLAGSVFYDGGWGEPSAETAVRVRKVRFDWVDLRRVQFSPFDPLQGLDLPLKRYAQFEDCTFIQADLRNATFNGAELRWRLSPPESHFTEEIDDDGRPWPHQTSYGPFDQADLAGTSFQHCVLKNADFRGAENVEQADFRGAKGLETARFDEEAQRSIALTAASNQPSLGQPPP